MCLTAQLGLRCLQGISAKAMSSFRLDSSSIHWSELCLYFFLTTAVSAAVNADKVT